MLDGPDTDRMDRALQQPLDLDGGHVHALAGKAEDLAHPDAVVVVWARGVGRAERRQPLDELRCCVAHGSGPARASATERLAHDRPGRPAAGHLAKAGAVVHRLRSEEHRIRVALFAGVHGVGLEKARAL